jgi:two-component system sensor histidine kinase LytS
VVSITLVLFERTGLLLVVAFMLTRIPTFRHLLDRELGLKTVIYHAAIFGAFGIVGAQAGIVFHDGEIASRFWVTTLERGETLIGSHLVAIVIAGLLGGSYVGLGAGCVTAVYFYFLSSDTVIADMLASVLTGLFAGLTARFFSNERVIAPAKALFIGMFAPIFHVCLLLAFTESPDQTVALVNTVGIPLVITNSVAIAIFTTMIRVALHEQEKETALETERALHITEQALPHLRQGLHRDTATKIARLLYDELKTAAAAVSISNTEHVLAHIGLGNDHHRPGESLKTRLSQKALKEKEMQIAYTPEHIQCQHNGCPLQAGIILPISQSGEIIGLIKLYYRRPQQIRKVDIVRAEGLAKLFSHQLDVVAAEEMKSLLREAEMRNLQAQINPHFLFNTLHLIQVLIRVDTSLARHITVQLGRFIRANLKSTSRLLIQLEQELEHFFAYLEIVKVRFSHRIAIEYDVDDRISDADIPPFTLQPLAENSLQHGLKRAKSGKLSIRVKKEGERIYFEIRDSGDGFPEHLLDRLGKIPLPSQKGNGIGLYNVNQRLVGMFGESAQLHFHNLPSGGCSVSFSIPIRHEHRDATSSSSSPG